MATRVSWSSRSGVRVTESLRIGRITGWLTIPLTKTKNGRKRPIRKGISIRL